MEAIPETCLPVSDIFLTNFVFTKCPSLPFPSIGQVCLL